MPMLVVVGALTALMSLAVVATRLRSRGANRRGGWPLHVHTVAGLVGLAAWTAYLVTGQLEVGIGSLFLVWLCALAGLVLLPRQLVGGRHAADSGSSRLARGAGVLAALGMVAAAGFFTWAYLVAAV